VCKLRCLCIWKQLARFQAVNAAVQIPNIKSGEPIASNKRFQPFCLLELS